MLAHFFHHLLEVLDNIILKLVIKDSTLSDLKLMVVSINVDVLNLLGTVLFLHKNTHKACLVKPHNVMSFFLPDVLDKPFQIFEVPEFGVTIKQSLEFGLAGRVRLTDDPDGLGVVLLLCIPFFLVNKGDLIVYRREAIRGFRHVSASDIRTK